MLGLQAMARALLSRIGGRQALATAGRQLAIAGAGGAAGVGLAGLFDGGDGRPRRRRRRRVLTANDRSDIAFIVATLGAPAGKAFAMIVAART